MGHGHGHGHAPATTTGADQRRRLLLAFAVAAVYLVVEVVVAVSTHSLALLSDAGHILTDVAGLGMALAALTAADRSRVGAGSRTFGLYRLEVLAALANAALLVGVAGYVLVTAARRFGDPVSVSAGAMLAVAGLGVLVNLFGFLLLREGAQDSLAMRAAYLESLSDLVGSVGVIVAALLIAATGARWIDPVFAIALGLWILPRTARLGAAALRVLLQAAPGHIDLDTLQADLRALPGVVGVHDLHVWTLTSQMEVATAHLQVHPNTDTHAVLDAARVMLARDHHLEHATLQVEPTDHTGCEEVGW
ncbi:MAG TPA: cation diffusion facilitator family transporter [Sporichthyaceae bacterium]|nr:cation diffusion facilitator family transporter [Sporichthyaceae bacterium]